MAKKKKSEKGKRPLLITIFCILGFIVVFITLIYFLIISGSTSAVPIFPINLYGGVFYPFPIIFFPLCGLAGLIGYWKMRKWGVYVYAGTTVVKFFFSIAIGLPFNTDYIGPSIVIIIGFAYLKRMT